MRKIFSVLATLICCLSVWTSVPAAQAFTLDKEDGEYSIQVELEGGLWGSKTGIAVAGAQKAVFACANEVAAIRFDERFCDEVVIFRVTVLDERALHRFFVRVARDVYRLHCARVEPRVVHAGRDRGRGGVEVLHLLRHIAEVAQIFRELYGVL